MTDYIGNPPNNRVIPVTKGADCRFTLRRRDTDGTLLDWGGDVYVTIGIDKDPVRVDAVVGGHDAVVRIESDVCDAVRNTTTWQAIISLSGDPSLELPLLVGTFERHDGKKPA